MSEERTAQASHADIIRGLREHYDSVSTKACSWASGIGHAIDAYEREPALRKRLADAEAALGKNDVALERLELAVRILLSQIDYGFLTWKAELVGTTKVIENARTLLHEAVLLTPHPDRAALPNLSDGEKHG